MLGDVEQSPEEFIDDLGEVEREVRQGVVRPGREHDMSSARADAELLARITDSISDGALTLADRGYEAEPETFTIPFKKPKKWSIHHRQAVLQRIKRV